MFNPASDIDGVSINIFLTRLSHISPGIFSWLVPGLIREKINFMVRALPKAIRLSLNPLNDFITSFLENTTQEYDLSTTLVNYLKSHHKIELKISELDDIILPTHLKFHFQIIDKNKVIASGDNLLKLKHQLAPVLSQVIDVKARDYTIRNIQNWQPELEKLLSKIDNLGYYSLQINGAEIDLVVIPDLVKARLNTRRAFLQLIKNKLHVQIKYLQQKRFKQFDKSALYLKNIYVSDQLLVDSIDFTLRMSVDLSNIPTNSELFNDLIDNCSEHLIANAAAFADILFSIASTYNELRQKLVRHVLSEELEIWLDDLIFDGFLRYVRFTQLEQYPRYLKAAIRRLEKYTINKERDTQLSSEIESLYEAWYNYVDKLEQDRQHIDQSLYDFKYKVEELRVSLFAQELKTPYPVSSKRLWRELEEFKK